ncbi:argininosuccinate lyase [Candidatus Methylacidithermus pantelleriae]|uniref:Argininosuccinate lyase n=1 Tax=Candidatus Methylacidithermus pantelleriae TaxID=2744239 RepID=A0A8J2BMA9_9BACT|nr:argininosuccinate lyase [Candidatus Methylacidithermus pantelleriae]CAF0689468.1 Argininosuccinate lyase [Candidatus Methylacidithermus pantelleriae]
MGEDSEKLASSGGPKPLWGGRFTEKPHPLFLQFTQSVSYDRRLYRQEITVWRAYAQMLESVGLLTGEERAEIFQGLDEIEREIEQGSFPWSLEREDLHMNLEAELTRKTKAASKLHAGRSRNDLVATTTRLWVKETIGSVLSRIRGLQKSLVGLGMRYKDLLLPGYTHLQRAQPVLLAHHLLAYVEMLERDARRLQDCLMGTDVLPLGSGALAGSTLPLDRKLLARLLGFREIARNSMDAVSDRDYVVEFCSACVLLGVHLSRLAEDLILWSSAEFGFLRLPEGFTSGSSLMPQKRNPDVLELVRGKSGRLLGNLVALVTMLKGLPMTYNRDMQEDKERLFDTADTVLGSLQVLALMLDGAEIDRNQCERAASDPSLLATDLVEWLVVIHGVPFRHAHGMIGKLVALAEQRGISLADLPVEVGKEACPFWGPPMRELLESKKSLFRRQTVGAPHPKSVEAELTRWQKRLGRAERPSQKSDEG